MLLDAAKRQAADPQQLEPAALRRLQEKYELRLDDFTPRVYWRLTDNWLELTVRLLVPDRGTREIKDAMARDVLAGLEAAGIGIASATSEIVGFPTLKVERVS